ncbi:hypothetical protein LTR39_002778 [Cryomyces antarcticus]|nr:hypothetical protein LTR39_002778 [Cryomyces antarcticus]
MSANGSFSQRADATVTEEDKHLASLRDASLVTAVACSCATLAFEGLWTRDLAPGSDFIHSMGAGSNVGLQHWGYGFGMLLLIGNGAVKNILLVSTAQFHGRFPEGNGQIAAAGSSRDVFDLEFNLRDAHTPSSADIPRLVHYLRNYERANSCFRALQIRRQGPLRLGFIALAAGLLSRLTTQFSQIWFTLLCTATSYLFLSDENTTAVPSAFGLGKRMRARHLITVVAIVSFAAITITYLRRPIYETGRDGSHLVYEIGPPAEAFAPLELANNQAHPVDQLIRDGETRFSALLARQSQTLEEAVTEYRRRYKIQPPPNFDRWYEFAKRKGVQLIDEYDNIHHSLLPFWALEPATIRGRVREALGFGDNNLMGLLIRAGGVTKIENGQEWLQQAVLGMIEDFVQFLPDMDLAFNIHDEPRVVVPHDELSRMVSTAKDVRIPLAFANSYPTNAFSARPRDVNDGKRIDEVKTTRFNVFAHQPTWTHSRLSCSPNSQARSLEDNAVDNATSYALGELGFIYNHTAFSDICNSPSLSSTYGFFDRPNSFNVVHDLVPIFSQSKISSFQDILYPSPWYWYGKVAYDEKRDVDWQKKQGKLWWRGSTTGGFSRNGGWRRQHRQQFVRKINDPYKVKILANTGEEEAPHWQPKEVRRADYRDIVDVHFSHVGQCDPGDCDAQREFFDIVKPADQQDAWKYRYLLDIDGNAFSGRFYAFLESKSLVYKMAIFREWHEEWIKPWVHYIPLSMRGDEWLESVRYFSGEEEGKIQAPRMAEQGRQWARKVLRNEDLEVWFFRLLLE